MKLEFLIKMCLATVTLVLIVLIVVKPSVDAEFHTKYLDNLDALDALSGSLVRNHLLVRSGQVKHYDFLESDLQAMQRFAQMVALTPGHADKAFERTAQSLSDEYLSRLEGIRDYVELSKRGIGLINNSTRAVALLLTQLNDQQLNRSDGVLGSPVLPMLVKLNQAYHDTPAFDTIRFLLDELAVTNEVDGPLIAQLRLHSTMLKSFVDPVENASSLLYKATDALYQPSLLRQQYLTRHESVVASTTWLLWTSYVLAALLVILAILLNIFAGKARKETERAMQEANLARESVEQQITVTDSAVMRCNELLVKIGQGDFTERLEEPFSGGLEDLRVGVNSAADSVQLTMSELQRVLYHMQCGDFTTQIDKRVTGDFRGQLDQTNQRLQAIMTSICDVMDDMRAGDFSRRVDMELEGDFDSLKSSVNDSMTHLSDSLGEIVSVVDEQAKGDFSRRIDGNWPGDLGSLTASLNHTGQIIHEMVGDIQQLSLHVAQVSNSVLENSEHLKSQSDQQARTIDVALQASRKVSDLINMNCQSIHSASELAARSQHEAGECLAISQSSTQTMQSVTSKISKINSITKTIELIASRTNLLALNAAVEASRAGNSGKGFSVVAGEVKALARMTADASADIAQIVHDTNHEADVGSSAASNATEALVNIEVSVKSVRDINSEISNSSYKQLEEMNCMTDRVLEAHELIKTNQAVAAETYSTSESLDALAQQMNTLISFFSDEGRPAASLVKAA